MQAGLSDVLIVTGRSKRAVEDHFDRNLELEHALERGGRDELLKQVNFATELAEIHYARQRDPLGLGHAVAVARHHVGREPFAVLLPDEIMVDNAALLRGMLDVYEREHASVIAVQKVTPEEISSYGCIDPVAPPRDGVMEMRGIVEKPAADQAPSNFAVSGRYLFTPEIFDALARITPGRGGELQLTDAIALLLEQQKIFAYVCERGRYDIGQKLDFLRANVELALDRPDLGPEFAAILRDIMRQRGLL